MSIPTLPPDFDPDRYDDYAMQRLTPEQLPYAWSYVYRAKLDYYRETRPLELAEAIAFRVTIRRMADHMELQKLLPELEGRL